MFTDFGIVQQLTALFGASEAVSVIRLARKQQKIENVWVTKTRRYIDDLLKTALADARETGFLKREVVDFTPLVMAHAWDVQRLGIISTRRSTPIRVTSLSAPRSLRRLREFWDAWIHGRRVPEEQRVIAEKLRKSFLDTLSKAWRRHAEEFLAGDEANQREAVGAIMSEMGVAYSRAKMVVETETTKHFNAARRAVYDGSDDVTHYLFLAIRDHATTKWCKTRHGLVYAKGDPLLEKETPPIHWYCRSEILPLTPANPAHAKLIADKSRARRHNSCEPLPTGWTSAK